MLSYSIGVQNGSRISSKASAVEPRAAVNDQYRPPKNAKSNSKSSAYHDSDEASFDPLIPQLKPEKGKFMLFFQHIPKTAGTAFANWTGENLGFFGYCKVPSYGTFLQDDIKEVFNKQGVPNCGLLHKEATTFVAEKTLLKRSKVPVLTLTFLRHPLTHIISSIGHNYAWGTNSDVVGKINSSLTRDCARKPENFKECFGYPLLNPQTSYLSGIDPKEAYNNTSLNIEDVLEKVKHLFFVGFTEHMVASQCLLMHQLGFFDEKRCNVNCITGEGLESLRINRAKAPNMTLTYTQLSMLHSFLENDNVLYGRMLEVFFARVRYVEKLYGVTLLCGKLDLSQVTKDAP